MRVRNGQRQSLALTLEAKSDIPIAAMESPSHPNDFAVAKHSDSYYEASLETRGGDLGLGLGDALRCLASLCGSASYNP